MPHMKKILYLLLIASLFGCSTPKKELNNIFYCFSNAGNLPNAPEGLSAKAAFFKNLGYDAGGGIMEKETIWPAVQHWTRQDWNCLNFTGTSTSTVQGTGAARKVLRRPSWIQRTAISLYPSS